MAVFFQTQASQALLTAFNNAITLPANQAGAIDTWERVNHGGVDYYTHRSQQYGRKAFFKPAIENNQLAFYIVAADKVPLTRDVYSYYAGHLAETFIRHFPTHFSWVQATPNRYGQDTAF
jgi:hypothetical protein